MYIHRHSRLPSSHQGLLNTMLTGRLGGRMAKWLTGIAISSFWSLMIIQRRHRRGSMVAQTLLGVACVAFNHIGCHRLLRGNTEGQVNGSVDAQVTCRSS